MKVGVFADTHDHLDNIRRAIRMFNEMKCECVLFAGDLVSTFAVPPLRQLNCPIYGCFGDNEGNRVGLLGGFRLIGELKDAPAEYTLSDGTEVVIAHMKHQLKDYSGTAKIIIHGHTHKPSISQEDGKLILNPGETSGWTYNQPTIAVLETSTLEAEILPIDTSEPMVPWNEERRAQAAKRSSQ